MSNGQILGGIVIFTVLALSGIFIRQVFEDFSEIRDEAGDR